MRRSVLLLLASCKQVFGLDEPARIDAALADTLDAEIDAPPDADTRSCIEKWLAGPTLSPPQPVTAVNTTADEWDPSLTHDGLELYFQRTSDIHVVTRPSLTAPWGLPTPSQFNTTSAESKVTFDDTKLRAYVASSRPGVGGYDLWRYRRDAVTDPWVAQQAFLGNVNTAADEHDPHLSVDQLRIYLAVAVGGQSVAIATRVDTMSAFGAPVVISEIDAPGLEGDPSLTADERVLVYAAGTTPRRLMYATRSAMGMPFSAGTELTQLNALVGYGDSDAYISPDGCALYFRSTRGGNGDIYMTTVQ